MVRSFDGQYWERFCRAPKRFKSGFQLPEHQSSLPLTCNLANTKPSQWGTYFFSYHNEHAGSYTGRDGKEERSYVSVSRPLERMMKHNRSLPLRLLCTQVWLLCNVSRLWNTVPAPRDRSAPDLNAALDLCQLLANSLLFDVRQQVLAALKKVRTGLCMKKRAPDKMATSRAACKFSSPHTTVRFG